MMSQFNHLVIEQEKNLEKMLNSLRFLQINKIIITN